MKRGLLLYSVLVSFITYQAYSYDKKNAQFNGPSKKLIRPRIPERTLHALSLVGGWPGALLGQQLLRHKTIKQPFQRTFWITVAVNVIVFVCLYRWIVS